MCLTYMKLVKQVVVMSWDATPIEDQGCIQVKCILHEICKESEGQEYVQSQGYILRSNALQMTKLKHSSVRCLPVTMFRGLACLLHVHPSVFVSWTKDILKRWIHRYILVYEKEIEYKIPLVLV